MWNILEFRLLRHSRAARAVVQLTGQVVVRRNFTDDYQHFKSWKFLHFLTFTVWAYRGLLVSKCKKTPRHKKYVFSHDVLKKYTYILHIYVLRDYCVVYHYNNTIWCITLYHYLNIYLFQKLYKIFPNFYLRSKKQLNSLIRYWKTFRVPTLLEPHSQCSASIEKNCLKIWVLATLNLQKSDYSRVSKSSSLTLWRKIPRILKKK